jgi:transposase
VITGTGQRRRFSKDDKARIVEETLAPGAVVSEVARRHGLSPPQLFGWRRQARQPLEATAGEDARLFVPAVVDARARCRPRGRNRTLANLARASMPPLRRYGFTATAAEK